MAEKRPSGYEGGREGGREDSGIERKQGWWVTESMETVSVRAFTLLSTFPSGSQMLSGS